MPPEAFAAQLKKSVDWQISFVTLAAPLKLNGIGSPMTLGVVLLLWLAPLRFSGVPVVADRLIGRAGPADVVALQNLTDDLRTRLQIEPRVHVTLVDHNPLVMSVETIAGRVGPFIITVDREFIRELNPEEVEAAIAHELGHVWIYTHPPYTQSERLANEIAMRVVRRSAFEPVYAKVWARTGIRGDLVEFIGPPTQQ
jgi:Zn-dependent protease with chaperone function